MIRRILPKENSRECVTVDKYNRGKLLVTRSPAGEPFLFVYDIGQSIWNSYSLRHNSGYSNMRYTRTAIDDIVSQLAARGWTFFEIEGEYDLSNWLRENYL